MVGRKPKYKCNIDYFNKIDTPNKAYVLGFIWADGYVSKSNGLVIAISRNDIEVLEFIKAELGTDASIKSFKDKYVRFSINRIQIYQSLVKLGLGRNKSKNNTPIPEISSDLLPHFLRGFFDGDGSIWISDGYRASFTKGYNFLLWLKKCLLTYGIVSGNIRLRWKDNFNGCSMDVTNRSNIEKLYNLLYTDSNFSLFRKEKLFLDAIDHYKKIDTQNWRLNGEGASIKELLDSGLYATEISKRLNINFNRVKRIIEVMRKEENDRNINKISEFSESE